MVVRAVRACLLVLALDNFPRLCGHKDASIDSPGFALHARYVLGRCLGLLRLKGERSVNSVGALRLALATRRKRQGWMCTYHTLNELIMVSVCSCS